jgi:transposase
MPAESLARAVLLPELRLTRKRREPWGGMILEAEKTSEMEVCPKCATPSRSVYDHRWVFLKDEPLQNKPVRLRIRKRRFRCPDCRRPFTEPVPGVRKGYRTTERYRRRLLWAHENFSDLKRVRRAYHCSGGLLYRVLYEQLELKRRQRQYPWPAKLGLDEHFFKHDKRRGFRSFVTMVVDHRNHRLMEVVDGKETAVLEASLAHIPGRENVRWVSVDMCDSYRSFVRNFFPNARLVADKFHVLRLVTPAINRYLRDLVVPKALNPLRAMLRKNRRKLKPWWRSRLDRWLEKHPQLRELYELKEGLSRFYRIKGYRRAAKALTRLTDAMSLSRVPEVQTLRRTLMRWRTEVLAYFVSRLTNARTEGYNAKAKLVKRQGYGYKSFGNYRLQLLNSCC